MTWNKLLSMVVRVSPFFHCFFWFKYIVCVFVFVLFYFCIFCIVKSFEEALSVMYNVQVYKTNWTLSLPIHVNGLLLIHEVNERAQKTQCFTLPCHSTQGRFDFTNIIFEIKHLCRGSNPRFSDRRQCWLTPRPGRHCQTS